LHGNRHSTALAQPGEYLIAHRGNRASVIFEYALHDTAADLKE
jgi:hypothetical protein